MCSNTGSTAAVRVFALTGVLDLSGVEVIQEWHNQTLTKVDLHQGHCHVLSALNCDHLLQHGQSTAVLHLRKGLLRSWHRDVNRQGFNVETYGRNCGWGWPLWERQPTPPEGGWGADSTRKVKYDPRPSAPSDVEPPGFRWTQKKYILKSQIFCIE